MQIPKSNQTLQQLDNREANKSSKRPIEDLFSNHEFSSNQEKIYKRLKRSSDGQLPEPKFNTEQKVWQISVPKDSNNLFLSATLVYLIPVMDDDNKFDNRFKKLFGDNQPNDEIQQVKKLIQSYNPFFEMSGIYNQINQKFLPKLREKVANYILDHKSDFESSINNIDDYVCNVKKSDTWGSNTEVTAIGKILEDARELKLFHTVMERNDYYSFGLEQGMGERYKEVNQRLEKFVKDFVSIYNRYLSEYSARLVGKAKKTGKWSEFIKKIIGPTEAATEAVDGVTKAGVLVALRLFDNISTSISEYHNWQELKKLTQLIRIYNEKPNEEMAKILVESGVDIFQSFESQFARVTERDGKWEGAMEKLAEDAVSRIVNYYRTNLIEEEFSSSLVTKGIILGESKEYKHNFFGVPHMKKGHSLKIEDTNASTVGFFEKVGLVTTDSNGQIKEYYEKEDNSNKYGFRLLLQWEDKVSGEKVTINPKQYTLLKVTPENKYKYLEKESLKKKQKEVLDKIKNENNKSKDEGLNIKQIMEDFDKDLKGDLETLEKNIGNNFDKFVTEIKKNSEGIKGWFSKEMQQLRGTLEGRELIQILKDLTDLEVSKVRVGEDEVGFEPNKSLKDILKDMQVVNIISDEHTSFLSIVRIDKILKHMFNKDIPLSPRIVIKFDVLFSLKDKVIKAFQTVKGEGNILIIDCLEISNISDDNVTQLYKELSGMLSKEELKKIILVTKEGNALAKLFKESSKKPSETGLAFQEHNDKISFDDLDRNSQEKILKGIVIFQGYRVFLNDLVEEEDLKKMISTQVLSELINKKDVVIGEALPDLGITKDYYINRKFNRKVKIKEEFLREGQDDDKFVILCEKDQLNDFKNEIVKKYLVSEDRIARTASIENLLPEEKNKLRFFLVTVTDVESGSFEKLCNNYPGKNIHLLKRENNEFKWQKSKGTLSRLRDKYIDKNVSSNDISEDGVNNDKLTVIAAEPGMGKSTVLTDLAKKIKEESKKESKELWVVKINLNDRTLLKIDIDPVIESPEDKDKRVIKSLFAIMKIDTPRQIDTDLEIKLFEHLFKQGKVVLLFDAFDEIGHDSEKKAIKLLQDIRDINKVEKLLVTTRTHKQRDLEDALGVFSYALEPLLPEEQKEFLERFWRTNLVYDMIRELTVKIEESLEESSKLNEINKFTNKISKVIESEIVESRIIENGNLGKIKELISKFKNSNLDKKKLEEITKLIGEQREASDKVKGKVEDIIKDDGALNTIKEDAENYANKASVKLIYESPIPVSPKEREFTEIPLQIRMLAEAFQGDFEEGGELVLDVKFTLLDLYRKFIESKYDTYFRKHLKEDLKGDKLKDIRESVTRTLMKEHRSMALEVLFSKEVKDSLRDKDLRFKNIQDVGIIEKIVNDSPSFIHRTFAEYFAADFFVDMLNKPKDHPKYQLVREFLRDNIFEKKNEVIRNFFDHMLAQDKENENKYEIHCAVLNNYKNKVEELLRDNQNIVDSSDKAERTPLHLAAAYGYKRIVQVLLKHNADVNVNDKVFDWNPLAYSIKYSGWYEWKDIAKSLLREGASGNNVFQAIEIGNKEEKEKGQGLLYIAAKNGYAKFIEAFLSSAKEKLSNEQLLEFVNAEDYYHDYLKDKGYAPLQWAVENDNKEVIESLLNSVKDEFSYEQLLKFIGFVNERAIIAYQECNREYESKKKKNRDRSGDSDKHQDRDKSYLAIKSGEYKPLCMAIKSGKQEVIKTLLNYVQEKLSPEQFLQFIDAKDYGYYKGYTLLHLAAENDNLDIVKLLVEKGASFAVTDRDDRAPLHMAAERGNLDLVKYLVEKEASLNIQDKDGKTPLHLAAQNSKWDVVKYLIEKGADLNIQDKDGKTPLHLAAEMGNLDLVKYLVEKEASLNIQDKDGKTPLHLAAENDKLDAVKYLVEKGASLNVSGNDSNTASKIFNEDRLKELLHLAVRSDNRKFVEVALKELNVDVKYKYGGTPLHLAAYSGKLDIVKYLIGQSANVNAKDENKRTPLHDAAENGYLEVVEYLIKNRAHVDAKDNEEQTPLDLVKKCLKERSNLEKAKQAYQTIIADLEAKDKRTTSEQEILDFNKERLNQLISKAESANPEVYERIINALQQKLQELWKDYIRERQEVEALECLSGRRKRETKAGECELSWDDMDKFSEEKEGIRDFSKIKINSDKFINYIKSESISGNKLEQLVQLAGKVQVTGKFQGLVSKLISNQKVMNHLNRVGRVSGIAMHGMMGKNVVADFLNGDYTGVAVNVGFIAGGQGFAKVAEAASLKGTGLVLDGKLFLGRSLKAASPFLARGTSAFVVYDLVSQIKEFKNGTEEALVSVIGDSIYLGVDAAEIGIEIAEAFDMFEGVSAITGPIGAAIGAVIFVGTDIYLAVKRVDKINEIIRLTGNERFFEGLRAFIGMQPEQYIEELMEEKEVSNQLVKQGLEYLQQHNDIQRYVFPTGKSVIDSCRDVPYKTSVCVSGGFGGGCSKTRTVTRYTEECTTKFQVDLDNKVLLNGKRTDIKWSRTKPDNSGELFCLPEGDYEQVPSNGAYLCNNAIGIESSTDKTGNYTFVNLGEGNDDVRGFISSPNIFSVSNGFKRLYGGNKDDLFVLQGDIITGHIDGGHGTNTVDLSEFASKEKSVLVNLNRGYIEHQGYGNNSFGVIQINKLLARKDKKDVIDCSCDTKYVNGQGGESSENDVITVPSSTNCFYKMQLVVKPNTSIYNHAVMGNFSYIVPIGSGKADVNLEESESRHDLFFNYTLPNARAINLNNIDDNITFSFSNTFEENAYDRFFNITILPNANNTFYKLNDNTEIKVGKKNLYAVQGSDKPVDEIVNSYPAIADRLKMSLFVQSLLSNETVAIGHGNHDVLHNNPYYKSHLVGNGGENIFVVTSGYETLDDGKLPIPEVVIYDVDKENLIDTLDLRQIKQQIVKDLGKEVKARTSMSGQDLLIELFYPNSTKSLVTVRLKNALITNWHERLQVILNDSPMKIEEFDLKPLPLVFSEDKEIVVITSKDVEEESKLVISKKAGDCAFARLGNGLIITNAFGGNLTNNELCTISLNNFYQEPKMQTLSIKFADKEILLKDEMDKINNASTLTEQLARYKNDTYNTIFNYGTTVSNITDLHRRKRRDESGVEANNSNILFHTQSNATFTIKNSQVTSGAGRVSSWINDCATWVKDSINGLVGHIDKNDQVFFSAQNNASFTIKNTDETSKLSSSWIITRGISKLGNLIFSSAKASLPSLHAKHPTLPLQQDNIQNHNLNLRSIDLDGTLLLLDVLIRKITGEKYVSSVGHNVTSSEIQASALSITEEFEEILNSVCDEPAIDFAEAQSNIFKAMMSGSGNKIPGILCSYVEEAKLEPEITKKILATFQPTKPTASTLGGHLPYLPENAKPQTCLSDITIGNLLCHDRALW